MTFSAQEILNQLGGRKFIAMTGAKNFLKDEKTQTISFKIPNGKNGIRFIEIRLNSMHTYDINFKTGSGKLVKRIEGIYNDQLQEIFTDYTGLYTHL